jgi:phenylalanyl-tRNA synthetase alpha chain
LLAVSRIEDFFKETPVLHNKPQFEVYDSLPPVVKITDNFDSLLIPPEHVSRKATDTYYVDDVHVLRTHTR